MVSEHQPNLMNILNCTNQSNGHSYYIAYIDVFSKYIWLYLPKNKSDALNAFKRFQNYVATQFNTSIKVVQSFWRGVQAFHQIFQ